MSSKQIDEKCLICNHIILPEMYGFYLIPILTTNKPYGKDKKIPSTGKVRIKYKPNSKPHGLICSECMNYLDFTLSNVFSRK